MSKLKQIQSEGPRPSVKIISFCDSRHRIKMEVSSPSSTSTYSGVVKENASDWVAGAKGLPATARISVQQSKTKRGKPFTRARVEIGDQSWSGASRNKDPRQRHVQALARALSMRAGEKRGPVQARP